MLVHSRKNEGIPEDHTKWEERMNQYQVWVDSQQLKSVKVGDKIDACDTENIWCKAQVELCIKSLNRKDLLYIHYEGWNRKYDEYLYIDSHRLAPLGVYTERRDIPIYRMMGNNNGDGPLNMMYAVVLSNAAEEERLQEQERRIHALHDQQQIEDEEEEDDEADEFDDNQNEESNVPDDPDQVQVSPRLQAQIDLSI